MLREFYNNWLKTVILKHQIQVQFLARLQNRNYAILFFNVFNCQCQHKRHSIAKTSLSTLPMWSCLRPNHRPPITSTYSRKWWHYTRKTESSRRYTCVVRTNQMLVRAQIRLPTGDYGSLGYTSSTLMVISPSMGSPVLWTFMGWFARGEWLAFVRLSWVLDGFK